MDTGLSYHMYYVAILCPPGIEQQVSKCKQYMEEQFGCRAASKSPAHITLVAPFWWPSAREQELSEIFRKFSSDLEPLTIRLEGFSHFNRKVLFIEVVENSELNRLYLEAQEYFAGRLEGLFRKDDRQFHPHITIATRDLKPGDFLKAWEHLSRKTYSAEFTSKSLHLLRLATTKWESINVVDWKR